MSRQVYLLGVGLALVALAFTATDAIVRSRHGVSAADQPRPPALAPALGAPRAMVYLTARWSPLAKVGERQFRVACDRLSAEHSALGVRCFVLEEDAPTCRAWLASLKTPILARAGGTGRPFNRRRHPALAGERPGGGARGMRWGHDGPGDGRPDALLVAAAPT
jgi:hypothetical protein